MCLAPTPLHIVFVTKGNTCGNTCSLACARLGASARGRVRVRARGREPGGAGGACIVHYTSKISPVFFVIRSECLYVSLSTLSTSTITVQYLVLVQVLYLNLLGLYCTSTTSKY